MEEIWKPISGYEGRYEVSSHGGVRSLPRVEKRSDGRLFKHPGGLLKPSLAKQSGHLRVNLRRDGQSKTAWVHQLVALAFLGDRPLGCEVRHWDGNPANNQKDNLRWGTRSENIEDRRRHGVLIVGERATGAILSESEVRAIKLRLRGGEKQVSLAGDFGVSAVTINNIATGKRWKHV